MTNILQDMTREQAIKFVHANVLEIHNITQASKMVEFSDKKDLYSHYFVKVVTGVTHLLYFMSVQQEERIYTSWYHVLSDLLHMTVLQEKEPITTFHVNYEGYGFKDEEYDTREHYVIQFLEGFLNAQTPKADPIAWCELGEIAGIVTFPK